jgi:four helix bundle protein
VTFVTAFSFSLHENYGVPCVPICVVQSYRDLIAWKKSMALVTEVYLCTRGFPAAEVYGLTSQLRRAAVSIPSNVAEGHGRRSTGEFKQFLGHARGSLSEVETQVLIARDLCYLNSEQTDKLLCSTAEVGRIINGLLVSLDRRK